MTTLLKRSLGLSAAFAVASALVGCSGGTDSTAGDRSPEEMLSLSQKTLAAAKTVEMTLQTDNLPKSVNGLVKAAGMATKAPAFNGDITVSINSLSVKVPVTAVDGKVWATLPGATEWSTIDPAEYGAPDPATLISENAGFGGLLGDVTGLEQGKDQLVDGVQLAVYTGEVPGAAMKDVMSSSDASKPFQGTFSIDKDGELRKMALTGVFYAGNPSLTYTLSFLDYSDTDTVVTAP